MFSKAANSVLKDRISDNLDLFESQLTRDPLIKFSRAILEIESTRADWRGLHQIELLQLLRKFRSREASDKRDKVFAFLGLIKHWQSGAMISPNYTIAADQVFWRTTISIISSAMSLSILAGTLQDKDATVNSTMPSWVVDWSQPPQPGEFERLSRLSMYNAAAGLPGSVITHGNLILEGKGFFVDEVALVGVQLPNGQVNRVRATVSEWLDLVQPTNKNPFLQAHQPRNGQEKAEAVVYPLGGTHENAFWRTLCADVLHVSKSEIKSNSSKAIYRRADDSGLAAYRAWRAVDQEMSQRQTSIIDGQWQDAAEPQEVNEKKNAFHYAMESASSSRIFFVTGKGYMGIGPSSMKKGDLVCVLLGSSVPFILRQSSEPRVCVLEKLRVLVADPEEQNQAPTCSQTHTRCYSLIGDTYVHGIMDGRAVKAARTSRNPKSIYLI